MLIIFSLKPYSTFSKVGKLDYSISLDELKKASSILKPGKALGIDNIGNEMIICLVESYPSIILKLFNLILQTCGVISDWVIGAIVPIFKKGSKAEPSNYRVITLLSCLGKLLIIILNNRLIKFVICQLGFISGNRTSDTHIIINNLVREYSHKKNLKIFSCFVDFAKAFDTVPRDILLKKLLSHGISGRFFNAIKNIYTKDKACIKIGSQYTGTIVINQGVRQGCVMSPLLFNIFLADLAEKFDSINDNIKMNNSEISALFWADDILILSKSEEGLTKKLKVLEEYTNGNFLEVNTDKTKVMIFNKTGKIMRRNFYING